MPAPATLDHDKTFGIVYWYDPEGRRFEQEGSYYDINEDLIGGEE